MFNFYLLSINKSTTTFNGGMNQETNNIEDSFILDKKFLDENALLVANALGLYSTFNENDNEAITVEYKVTELSNDDAKEFYVGNKESLSSETASQWFDWYLGVKGTKNIVSELNNTLLDLEILENTV